MRVLKSFSIALLACAILCSTSVAGAAPEKNRPTLSNSQIKTTVEQNLSKLDLDPSQVKVSVRDGVVTLSGTVPSIWLKLEAITRARKADAVKSVVADLTVRRAESDQKLADEIAKRLRQYVFYTI